MKTFEIREAQNGFVIWSDPPDRHMGLTRDKPFVFETLENALNFLRKQFTESQPPTDKGEVRE